MKKQAPRKPKQKRRLPAEYLTVDYLPPIGPRQVPVRGGKRKPSEAEEAAEKYPIRATRKGG